MVLQNHYITIMEFLLQQLPIQENLIPLLSEADLLNLSRCSTGCKKACDYWIGQITLPNELTRDVFYDICRDNKIISLVLAIRRGYKEWDAGLAGACKGGYGGLAELMISKGATDLDLGLGEACKGGHRDLAELMISKGANNWVLGLEYACLYCNPDIVELMFEKGASVCYCCGKSMEEHLSH